MICFSFKNVLEAPTASSFGSLHNHCVQALIPISRIIPCLTGNTAERLNDRYSIHPQIAKMTGRHDLITHLRGATRMSCPLFKSSSADPIIEKENIITFLAQRTLSSTTDSSQCKSGGTSDDDRPSHSTITDAGCQGQPDLSTRIPQAGADDPYHVFGNRMKWVVVAQIGAAGTFSGLSSNIYFPCLKTITKVNRNNLPHISSFPLSPDRIFELNGHRNLLLRIKSLPLL